MAERSMMRAVHAIVAAVLIAAFHAAWGAEATILRPHDGETVHDNSGRVTVHVAGVTQGNALRVFLDGARRGKPYRDNPFVLEGIDRGEHILSVAVIDSAGKEIARTPQVHFHMWRASRLFPNRR